MKKLTALLHGAKFTDKLLELKEKEVGRKLEAYKAEAAIEYEKMLHALACPNADYQEVLSAMVDCKQRIADADATLKVIAEIEEDLNEEIEDSDN